MKEPAPGPDKAHYLLSTQHPLPLWEGARAGVAPDPRRGGRRHGIDRLLHFHPPPDGRKPRLAGREAARRRQE